MHYMPRLLSSGGRTRGHPARVALADFYGGYFRDLDGNKLAFYIMK